MKASFKLEDVDKVEATLTITMPIGEWRALMLMIPSKWPGWKFVSIISAMISKAEKGYFEAGVKDE